MADLLPAAPNDCSCADVRDLERSVAAINTTLASMASDEVAELRRRADLPRRLLYAVGVPVFTFVVGSLILVALGAIHAG